MAQLEEKHVKIKLRILEKFILLKENNYQRIKDNCYFGKESLIKKKGYQISELINEQSVEVKICTSIECFPELIHAIWMVLFYLQSC